MHHSPVALTSLLLLGFACSSTPEKVSNAPAAPQLEEPEKEENAYPVAAPETGQVASQPGVAVRTQQPQGDLPTVRLERLSAGIPWPRGIALVDDQFVVLARGRHRNYGGPDQAYEDYAARLYTVDPSIAEVYEPGRAPSEAMLANARVLAEPDPTVVNVFDRSKAPLENVLMNRPYCTLAYDGPSRNLIFCAYSGVDMTEKPHFRKNATDALYRYDLRNEHWGIVELHAAAAVPESELGAWISNEYYPHHDPLENSPPHGLLNGPNGCTVAGKWLYAVGKDNHTLARYDLSEIRRDPHAPAPASEVVLGEEARVRIEGELRTIPIQGHSAVAARDGWLYVAFRTTNIVLRFPIDAEGNTLQPMVGELIAEFEPFDPVAGRGADLWDLALDAQGRLYVSASREGRVWRIEPDPAHPFDGNDKRAEPKTPNRPYLDMPAFTGVKNARISNLAFDAQDRLVFCVTMTEESLPHAGGIFRVVEVAN